MVSERHARHCIDFIENLKLEGRWAGKPFKLLKWQSDLVYDVYGTLKDNGFRQYEHVYLEVPKKNGKTQLAAALGLYQTFADGENNGEVYGAAAEKIQASIAFDAAVNMVDQSPALKKRCKLILSKKRLEDKITKTFYQVISAEAYSKHGYKPSAVIIDEIHCHQNRELYDVLTFGAGDIRDQPIWFVITTAGDDPDRLSIGWEVHSKAKRIIDGEVNNPRWYCKIYGADKDDDIWDEDVWHKANPSLGQTIDLDKVRAAAESAKDNPSEEKLFRWLRLNQWIDLKTKGWLSLTLWDNTNAKKPIELTGKKCYGGLDLSSTTDLTALTLLFPPQDGLDFWYSIYFAWIPENSMKKREKVDGVPYREWVNAGFIKSTPGNAVDYSFIESHIVLLSKQYKILCIGTDQWNSRMLTQRLKNKNDIDIVEVPQTMAGMNPPMKYTEKVFLDGRMLHEKNPVARWCFGNVVVVIDGNENIKPMKDKSKERIDIAVSHINAMAIGMEEEKESVYNTRGLTVL